METNIKYAPFGFIEWLNRNKQLFIEHMLISKQMQQGIKRELRNQFSKRLSEDFINSNDLKGIRITSMFALTGGSLCDTGIEIAGEMRIWHDENIKWFTKQYLKNTSLSGKLYFKFGIVINEKVLQTWFNQYYESKKRDNKIEIILN